MGMNIKYLFHFQYIKGILIYFSYDMDNFHQNTLFTTRFMNFANHKALAVPYDKSRKYVFA